jgi:outer membrane receptor protein involved in Fe transport
VGVDLEMPVGPLSSAGAPTATIVARHLSSLSIQSISNIDPALNPYLIDQRDRIDDDSIEYDNDTATATITLEADVRRELLDAPAALAPGPPSAAQTQRSIVGRSVWSPTSHLHYTAALYLSRYDTFGSSEDPRVSFVWSPTASAVLRMSMGTAFRAPLLTERAFNPTLTAERTTEYELGYEVRVGSGTRAGTAALNLYRTNLRDPIFFNLNAAGRLTFLANLGRVVYQGAGVSYDAPLTGDTTLHARYGVDIAYPIDNPFAHDPAAPNVVAGQQFQGIPPRKASLGLDHRAGRFDTGFEAAYTTANNPLNRPAYVSLNANTGLTMGRSALALQVLNLTNEFDDRFTLPNAGTPYPTPFGLAPTNAYSLPGRSVTLTFTQKL